MSTDSSLWDLSDSLCDTNVTSIDCIDFIKYIAAKFECFCPFGGNQRLEKKVSFSKSATIHVLPSEPTDIFWINKRDLLQLYQQKSQMFNNNESLEFKVLDLVAGVIEKSHLIFEHIYRFVNKFDGYDLCLSQTNVQVNETINIYFPNSKLFTKLQINQDYFKKKTMDLLNLLKPTYEINEHLFELMNHMDKTKKINSNLFEEINSEEIKIHFIVRDLTDQIQNCRFDLYRRYVSDIRMDTNDLEFELITLDIANRRLSKTLKGLKEVEKLMGSHLKLAMEIDFRQLYEATARFYTLVDEALFR